MDDIVCNVKDVMEHSRFQECSITLLFFEVKSIEMDFNPESRFTKPCLLFNTNEMIWELPDHDFITNDLDLTRILLLPGVF